MKKSIKNPLDPEIPGEGWCCVCYFLFVTESTVAIQVLQNDFSGCLVLIPDESQPEQETPECILLFSSVLEEKQYILYARSVQKIPA